MGEQRLRAETAQVVIRKLDSLRTDPGNPPHLPRPAGPDGGLAPSEAASQDEDELGFALAAENDLLLAGAPRVARLGRDRNGARVPIYESAFICVEAAPRAGAGIQQGACAAEGLEERFPPSPAGG